ncbi:MAG: CPBP family intramembrane glutamic endopeptidase, partial [Gemmatimonadaceae bacterium]
AYWWYTVPAYHNNTVGQPQSAILPTPRCAKTRIVMRSGAPQFTRTALLSGIIWSAWHLPLIIFADYNGGTPPAYSIMCFVIMVIGISFPMAWIRLRSGSIWPAALLHASHNLYIQGFFDRVTDDTGITKYLLSEFGAVLALTAVITGYLFWRRRDQLGPTGGISDRATAERIAPETIKSYGARAKH